MPLGEHRPCARPTDIGAALDDYELRGQPASATLIDAVGRYPVDARWPELARAQPLLQ